MSINEKARFSAAVPLLTAIQSSEPRYFLNWISNYSTFPAPEPDAQNLLSKTWEIFCLSSFPKSGSNSLIFFFIADYPNFSKNSISLLELLF